MLTVSISAHADIYQLSTNRRVRKDGYPAVFGWRDMET
jgi:hypothetical protein